jgi:hypothetical protein
MRDGRLEAPAIVSRFPVAFRLPAFAFRSSDSRRGVPPSSWSAYRPAAGRRRGYRVPHARAATGVGAPIPRGRPCSSRTEGRAQPAPAATAASPSTLLQHPIGRGLLHEASTRVHTITRPVFPSPVAARMERAALGLSPWASHPADQEPDDARRGRGQAIEHGPGTTLYDISRTSNLACSLNACDLASHRPFQASPAPERCRLLVARERERSAATRNRFRTRSELAGGDSRAALLRGARLSQRTRRPGSRSASHEEQDGGDEEG